MSDILPETQVVTSGRLEAHPQEKRYDVVRTILTTGNTRLAAELHQIPLATVAAWKRQPWWPTLVEEVKREQRTELQSKLGKLAVASLEIMEDRLANGEYILNNKTGEFVKKPVGLRDANQAMNNLLQQHAKLEELNSKQTEVSDSVSDVLKQLANEFAKFNKKNTKTVIDVDFKEV